MCVTFDRRAWAKIERLRVRVAWAESNSDFELSPIFYVTFDLYIIFLMVYIPNVDKHCGIVK